MLNLSKNQLQKLEAAVEAAGVRVYRTSNYETLETVISQVSGSALESTRFPGSFSVPVPLKGGTVYATVIGDPDATEWRVVTQAARADDPEYGIVAGQTRLAAIAL